jgi:hypothetical protein
MASPPAPERRHLCRSSQTADLPNRQFAAPPIEHTFVEPVANRKWHPCTRPGPGRPIHAALQRRPGAEPNPTQFILWSAKAIADNARGESIQVSTHRPSPGPPIMFIMLSYP